MLIKTPPHLFFVNNPSHVDSLTRTCQGNSPNAEAFPPTILPDLNCGRTPHSMDDKKEKNLQIFFINFLISYGFFQIRLALQSLHHFQIPRQFLPPQFPLYHQHPRLPLLHLPPALHLIGVLFLWLWSLWFVLLVLSLAFSLLAFLRFGRLLEIGKLVFTFSSEFFIMRDVSNEILGLS